MVKSRLMNLLMFAAAGAYVASASTGAVYTMTNDPKGNAVVAYSRAADGTLTQSGTFATGGTSIGAFATGNQNGILLNGNASCLWAVNSASNNISAFQVSGTSLSRVGVVDSTGVGPVSLTLSGNFLYVLHNGSLFAGTTNPPAPSPDNIAGFTVNKDCSITSLSGSTRSLSKVTGTFPAEVSFDPTGGFLIVTEKATNLIDVWEVDKNGQPSGLRLTVASSGEPFGFTFDSKGRMVLTEADCHMPTPPGVLPGCTVPPDTPTLAIYKIGKKGVLKFVSSSSDTQAAKCWVVVSGNFAFVVNALALQSGGTSGAPPAGSVTSYKIAANGTISELGNVPVPTALNGLSNGMVGVPVDAAVSSDGKFLYVLSEGDGTIITYSIGSDGTLTFVGNYKVTPVAAITVGGPFPNGLAAQ